MQTIVWDIDDVLNDLMRSWFELRWKRLHPENALVYADLIENPPHRILGIKEDEYLASLDEFRLSPDAEAMTPDSKLLDWFMEQGAQYRHIALTARPIKTVAPAAKWVTRYYGEWFQSISYIPAKRSDEFPKQPDKSKKDFLAWLGKADYFIDDHAGNVKDAEGLGITVFLVTQPWNKGGMTMTEILSRITA